MAEIRTPVTQVYVDMECGCGEGVMRPTGVCLTSLPPQYPHTCTACQRMATFRVTYPRVEIGEPTREVASAESRGS